MKKEDFKVGMKFKWNDEVFEVLDINYIDFLVIAKYLSYDLITGINRCCYEDMVEIKNDVPKVGGVLYVVQRKKDPRQVMAKYIDVNGDVYIGVAKCNPEDEFDFQVGADLAIKRALQAKEECDTLNKIFKNIRKDNKQ